MLESKNIEIRSIYKVAGLGEYITIAIDGYPQYYKGFDIKNYKAKVLKNGTWKIKVFGKVLKINPIKEVFLQNNKKKLVI
ncbi:MAG: hypothetical protein ACRC7S_01150 [Cetobacterium sp.]